MVKTKAVEIKDAGADHREEVICSSEKPVVSPFLSTKGAAKYLGLRPDSLVKRRYFGQGPCFRKHGKNVFYHIDDLVSWSVDNSHNKH